MGARTWSWTEEWVLDDDGRLARRWRRVLPKIRDSFLDAVVFLYGSEDDAVNGVRTGGSGFLAGIHSPQQQVVHLYVVTNRHVAEGGCSAIRLTSRRKDSVIQTVKSFDDWIFPENGDDLAAWHMMTQVPSHDQDYSYVLLPHYAVGPIHDYGPGDECFMLGRFVTKDGRQRNQPSARFGNISMLPQEPFERKPGVFVDAFLVETRSQAGYSGSPVFVYRKEVTVEMPIREVSAYKRSVTSIDLTGKEEFDNKLLGIDFAHLPNLARIGQAPAQGDGLVATQHRLLPDDARVELGSGMLAVVPAWKLVEMLNRSEVRAMRENPTPSELVEEVATTDPDPGGIAKTSDLLGKLAQVPPEEADEVHRTHQP